MTKAEKLTNETRAIMKFTGDVNPFSRPYNNYDEVDRIITKIQDLGYTFTLITTNNSKGRRHVVGFNGINPPFDNIPIISDKTRLDAMYELVLKFIKEKDEQR